MIFCFTQNLIRSIKTPVSTNRNVGKEAAVGGAGERGEGGGGGSGQFCGVNIFPIKKLLKFPALINFQAILGSSH